MLHAFYFKPDAEKMIGQDERINQKTIPRDCFRLENKKSLSEKILQGHKKVKILWLYYNKCASICQDVLLRDMLDTEVYI